MSPPPDPPRRLVVSRARLVADLLALGLERGRVVMVHASLRRLGPLEGGATTVIEAVREALGPSGTMLMVLSAREGAPFDANDTPVDTADMGVLAEVFRTTRDVAVSDHAADRFAALGPHAARLLSKTPLHDYHGPGSVLERLVAEGGAVLRLGANIDTVTLTHHAEYLARVPRKRRVRRRYVRADVGEQWIESLDDCDGIAQWSHGDYFPRILLDYLEGGHARRGRVGNCDAELLDAPHFTRFAVLWLERHLVEGERHD